ncbi:MAG: HlyD family efflux transporter periplasmic adaptor subunit [Chryseotalea sp.]|jgi:multidrug efflux pump subunit AcrA (membrane-fusion protein)
MQQKIINNSLKSDNIVSTEEILQIRSDLMQDIVSDRPGFLIRWSNVIFFLILILIITICWFIQYPDIVQASGKLTSINAPKPVICPIEGKLVLLKIVEDANVKKGDVLGFIESTAKHQDVLQLRATIDTIQRLLILNKVEAIKGYLSKQPTNLGELQISYQTFSQAYLSFENYLSDGFYHKKKAMLLQDKRNLLRLNQTLNDQLVLQEQDLALIQKTFDANEFLKKNEVISDFDYRLEQSKLINKKLALPQIKALIINNESQQVEKEREITELDNSITQQKVIFQQSLNTLKSQVDDWYKKYVLSAPINGKVSFTSFIQENQQLNANQIVCYINPENSQYYAEVLISQSNFGKVAVGQTVLLKLQSYPFREFGSLVGTVEFISNLPSEDGYLAKISLKNNLTTTYKRKIHYREGLTTSAEIVTKDLRLLERFYNTLMNPAN